MIQELNFPEGYTVAADFDHADAGPIIMGSALRDPHWHTESRKFIALYPTCKACGGNKLLAVHHKLPYHLYPHLEMDPKNWIVLCESSSTCHFLLGHGKNWSDYIPNVEELAAIVLAAVQSRVKG